MKPVNLAEELKEQILYKIDTPYDSEDMDQDTVFQIMTSISDKLEHVLEYRLGDVLELDLQETMGV